MPVNLKKASALRFPFSFLYQEKHVLLPHPQAQRGSASEVPTEKGHPAPSSNLLGKEPGRTAAEERQGRGSKPGREEWAEPTPSGRKGRRERACEEKGGANVRPLGSPVRAPLHLKIGTPLRAGTGGARPGAGSSMQMRGVGRRGGAGGALT